MGDAQVGRGVWFLICAVAAVALCLLSTGQAMAATPKYFNSWTEIPSSEVSFVQIGSDNLKIEHSSDITCTALGTDSYYYPGYRFDTATSYHGEGWIKLTFAKGAKTWDGRDIDVEIYINNIDRYNTDAGLEDDGSDNRGVFSIAFLYAKSCTLRFADNSQGSDPGYSEMDCTVKLRYSDTKGIVKEKMSLSFNDLDVYRDECPGVYEGVRMKSGFAGDVWLAGNGMNGTGININDVVNNNFVHGNHAYCADESNYHCGAVIPGSGNADMKIRWQGHGCATALGLRQVTYPYSKVTAPTKSDAEGVHFDGDTMTYTIDTFWPYANSTHSPSTVRLLDTLDPALDWQTMTLKVYQNGADVTSQWSIHNDNSAKVCAHRGGNSLPQGAYRFVISAKVKANYDFSSYAKTDLASGGKGYLVPNKALQQVDNPGENSVCVSKESNTAHGVVSWGKITVDVASANDSVSQLGQNGCYTLAGTTVGIYKDEACTQLVETLMLDATGHGESKRVPIGDYYIGEIKAPTGFANNELIDSVTVKGLLTTEDHRENVPQSEDLDGSIISKRDGELESIGERLNKWLQQWIEQ